MTATAAVSGISSASLLVAAADDDDAAFATAQTHTHTTRNMFTRPPIQKPLAAKPARGLQHVLAVFVLPLQKQSVECSMLACRVEWVWVWVSRSRGCRASRRCLQAKDGCRLSLT